MVKGREGKTTPLVTMVEEGLGVNKVKLNKGIRKNIRVRPGEAVTIQGCAGLPYGKSIRVRPFADKIKEGGGADFQVLLKHYYQEAYRPAAKGDLFSLDGVEFKITETNPSPYCIVSNDTAILYDNYPLQREHNETSLEDTPTDTNI
uniref:CDC48 domain-containing protein n=1 Tax=Arcella intermedia TaxID=1963864 RepID=A0A6B2LM00_9EUKA